MTKVMKLAIWAQADAIETADKFLDAAIETVNRKFGDAKKYPEIVAAHMQVAAADFHAQSLGTLIKAGLVDASQNVHMGLDRIADAVEHQPDIAHAIFEVFASAKFGEALDGLASLTHKFE